jgi:hypothetical protein
MQYLVYWSYELLWWKILLIMKFSVEVIFILFFFISFYWILISFLFWSRYKTVRGVGGERERRRLKKNKIIRVEVREKGKEFRNLTKMGFDRTFKRKFNQNSSMVSITECRLPNHFSYWKNSEAEICYRPRHPASNSCDRLIALVCSVCEIQLIKLITSRL